MLYTFNSLKPQFAGEGHFIAPGAMLVGNIMLEAGCSVWFNAVVRADSGRIVVHEGANIQDCAVLHTDNNGEIIIGRDVTIGHAAKIHGCSIADNTLIGIGAIVLNNAKIGRNCIIGAGALVGEGRVIPDGSLVLGIPGRVARELSESEIAGIAENAEHYRLLALRYAKELGDFPK